MLIQLGFQSALYESSVRLHHVLDGQVVVVAQEFRSQSASERGWGSSRSISSKTERPTTKPDHRDIFGCELATAAFEEIGKVRDDRRRGEGMASRYRRARPTIIGGRFDCLSIASRGRNESGQCGYARPAFGRHQQRVMHQFAGAGRAAEQVPSANRQHQHADSADRGIEDPAQKRAVTNADRSSAACNPPLVSNPSGM